MADGVAEPANRKGVQHEHLRVALHVERATAPSCRPTDTLVSTTVALDTSFVRAVSADGVRSLVAISWPPVMEAARIRSKTTAIVAHVKC